MFTCLFLTHSFKRTQDDNYQKELSAIEEEYKGYKTDAESEKQYLEAAVKAKEKDLQNTIAQTDIAINREIQDVKKQLENAQQEMDMAQQFTDEVRSQKIELEADFAELKRKYVDDHVEWEDKLEMEQNTRTQDIAAADAVLQQVKEEMNRQVRQARAEGKKNAEAVHSELSNRLWQKETVIQKTELALKRSVQENMVLEQKVERYEGERQDLQQLATQAARVAKGKTFNTLQKARNFFRRNKMG